MSVTLLALLCGYLSSLYVLYTSNYNIISVVVMSIANSVRSRGSDCHMNVEYVVISNGN